MEELRKFTINGALSKEELIRAADVDDPIFALVEAALKGPELELEDGYFFIDKGGHRRRHIRRKWWDSQADSWRDIALSVPDLSLLPETKLPPHVIQSAYPSDAPPVFFGHYWMEGTPVQQAPNALCLDYSAGKGGPLVTYCAETGHAKLNLDNLTVHE